MFTVTACTADSASLCVSFQKSIKPVRSGSTTFLNPNSSDTQRNPFWKTFKQKWNQVITCNQIDCFMLQCDWLVCCLLAGPNLWKSSIVMVYTCTLRSWCKFSVGCQGYVTMETIWKNTGGFVYEWLIGMLLVSRSGLVEVFHRYGVHLPSSLLMQIFSWLPGLCYYGDDMEEYRRLLIWLIDRYAAC